MQIGHSYYKDSNL